MADVVDDGIGEIDPDEVERDAKAILEWKPGSIPVAVQAAALSQSNEARAEYAAYLNQGADAVRRGTLGKLGEPAKTVLLLVYGRPAMPIRDGQLTRLAAGWRVLEPARYAIEQASRSVGCIEVGGGASWKVVGTAFRTAPNQLTTAWHVVTACREDARIQLEERSAPARREQKVRFNWRREAGRSTNVTTAVWGAKQVGDADIATLCFDERREVFVDTGDARKTVEVKWPLVGPLKLDVLDPAAVGRRLVVAIGYPSGRAASGVTAKEFKEIFGDEIQTKRAMPGKLNPSTCQSAVLEHDCSTLGGVSGGPLLLLGERDGKLDGSAQVVGLHLAGEAMASNWATVLAPTECR